MVNIAKPPKDTFCNNYNTIAKEIKEHQNLFPEVGHTDFSTYKRRTSTVNYDIIAVARQAQQRLEAIQNGEDGDTGSMECNDSKHQAMQFQSLLEGKNANAKRSGKGVRFGISVSMSSEEDESKEFIDYHIDDNEDKENLRTRRLLFTTLRGARDSLAMTRPKFNVPEPLKFRKLDPEPKPISAIDILVQQSASIYLSFQPPNSNLRYIQEQGDIIVTIRKSFQIQDTERIICHSQILTKSSNAFKEMFDLHVWDMELQERRDIHCATTTDEGVWRTTDRVVPIYIPCHVHLEETTRPPFVVKKKLGVDSPDPYCSRHESFENWVDPKGEDRQCEEIERGSDNFDEMNPLHEEYHKIVDEGSSVDASNFVRNQSVAEILPIESTTENIDAASEVVQPLSTEEEEPEVDFGEELANFPADMELVERRKIEANALLMTCKPFLFSLAASEIKDTLDDQMLENLQKFVTLADAYFVLTNPENNDIKRKSVKFENNVANKFSSIVAKGSFSQDTFQSSLHVKESIDEGKKEKDLIVPENNIQGGVSSDFLTRNSTMESIERVSQIKRPSEVFSNLKAKRKESILRRKKSVIRKILYPIEKTPLIEHEAHLLDIEQQLNLCLPPPMAWQLETQNNEKRIKEENVENEGVELSTNKINEDDRQDLELGEVQIEEDGEDEEPDEEVCKREHQHDVESNVEQGESKIFKIIKGDWTRAIFYPMLEYFYTERCHVPCADVALLWSASAQILLQSLTNLIILHPINEYCHLALKTEANRKSMLELANVSYKSEIGSNMKKLKHFCELFKYGGAKDFLPYTFSLYTAYIADRKIEVVEEGFHELANFDVCILKVYDEKEQLFAQNASGIEFLTFEKGLQDHTQHQQHVREHWHGRKADEPFLNNNRHKQWSITIFGGCIVDECFKFYEYLVGQTFRMKEPETLSLHMPIPFLKQPVLHKALKKAFPKNKLLIESNRGMTYYIGGETHGNSLTVTGDPLLILEAIKCIPRDMVARMALRLQAPTKKTFLKVFSVTRTIGIDIEKDQIFLLKNCTKLKLALEYFVGLSDQAFIPLDVPREFTELVVPSKPF